MQGSVDGPGMAKIGSHPVRRVGNRPAGAASPAKPDCERRRFMLGMPIKGVVVPAIPQVEEDPGCRQELHSFPERSVDAWFSHIALELPQPAANVRVAQPTRGILDVGLQVEQRSAKARMPLPRQRGRCCYQRPRVTLRPLFHRLLPECFKDRRVSGNETSVQQCEATLRVHRFEPFKVSERPRHWRYLESAIPKRLGDSPYALAGALRGRCLLAAKEQIDVGEGEELTASIASKRQQAKLLPGADTGAFPRPQRPQELIHSR